MADDTSNHELGDADFDGERDALTTNSGEPVPDNRDSRSAGAEGTRLLEVSHHLETMAQLNRERTPERVVNAKGGGAYGTVTVTNVEISEVAR